MVTSRLCGIGEVPTTVLTSVYCDLVIGVDRSLAEGRTGKKKEPRRKTWRRVGAIVGITLGGISGGWIARSSAGLAGCLWVATGLKVGVAFGWLFVRAEDQAGNIEGTR